MNKEITEKELNERFENAYKEAARLEMMYKLKKDLITKWWGLYNNIDTMIDKNPYVNFDNPLCAFFQSCCDSCTDECCDYCDVTCDGCPLDSVGHNCLHSSSWDSIWKDDNSSLEAKKQAIYNIYITITKWKINNE